MKDNVYWLWFYWATIKMKVNANLLLERYGQPIFIFNEEPACLASFGITQTMYNIFFTHKFLDDCQDHIKRHESEGISICLPPVLGLNTSNNVPCILYVRGKLPKKPLVAIVGTRKMTKTGSLMVEEVSDAMSMEGFDVLGGMSPGVECHAHRYALNQDRPTYGFLPHALDQYNSAHIKRMMDEIVIQGALISKVPLESKYRKSRYHERNFLMAQLASRVILIEADAKSGSLLTCREALKIGKPTFAVRPFVSSSCCEGNHLMISEGASPFDKIDSCSWQGPELIQPFIKDGFVMRTAINTEISYEMLLDLESRGWIEHKRDGRWLYKGWY